MAEYHLHAKTHSRGAGKGAGGHVRYILRDGPYSYCEQECVFSESANMPIWARTTADYWDAADKHERANGTVYREIEFALPRELAEAENIKLARSFADSLAMVQGGKTPYSFAIHSGEENPLLLHCHLMLSDKVNDGIDRDAGLWFRRASNPGKDPARGGAPKTQERISTEWLNTVVRPLWEHLANHALQDANVDARIDRRTLDAQRMELEALARRETDQGKRWALEDKADALDRPAQPKKGRVLTHAGPEKAPDRAAMVVEYEQAKAERLAIAKSVRIARREVERLKIELARAKAIKEAQQVRHDRRDVGQSRAKWQDRQTARETSPGIRHPEQPKWQQYREQVLTDAYNRDVAQALGRWVQIERMPEGLRIHNRNMDITDHGDRITAGMGGQEKEIEAILTLARAKGWDRLDITGSAEFREKLGRAAIADGFALADTDLRDRIMEQQRQEAATRENANARECSRAYRLERAFHLGQLERLDDPHNHCQEAEDARNVGRAFTVLAITKDAMTNAFAIVESDPPTGSRPMCFRCSHDLQVGQKVILFVNRDNAVEVVADISPVDRPTESPSPKLDDAAPG